MSHSPEIGLGHNVHEVQISPVKDVVAVILREGRAVKVPESVNGKPVTKGGRPQFDGSLKFGQTARGFRAAAQVDGQGIAFTRQLPAVRRGEKNSLGREWYKFSEKLLLRRHPDRMPRHAAL